MTDVNAEDVATYLKQAMIDAGIGPSELAKRANLAASVIMRYCAGRAVPGHANAQKLAEVLNIPFATLALLCGIVPADMIQPPAE